MLKCVLFLRNAVEKPFSCFTRLWEELYVFFFSGGLRSTAAKCQQEPTSKDTNTVKSIFRLYVTDGLALYYDYPPELVFGLTFEHLTATLIHSLIWYPHTDELKSQTAFFKLLYTVVTSSQWKHQCTLFVCAINYTFLPWGEVFFPLPSQLQNICCPKSLSGVLFKL